MKLRPIWISAALVALAAAAFTAASYADHAPRHSEEEFAVLGEDAEDTSPTPEEPSYESWQRPAGPLRVGLQVGHWKNGELPDELQRLRERGGGTRGGGKLEWEVNLAIARATATLLEERGVVVDIIPATVPVSYLADLFVAIHADGSTNTSVSGFKVASPRRDRTGRGQELTALFEKIYGERTGLRLDPNVTRNMRGYYAFNWRRYQHAIHPMTPAIILETGFLTSPSDQRLLIQNPERAARATAEAILQFLGVPPTEGAATDN